MWSTPSRANNLSLNQVLLQPQSLIDYKALPPVPNWLATPLIKYATLNTKSPNQESCVEKKRKYTNGEQNPEKKRIKLPQEEKNEQCSQTVPEPVYPPETPSETKGSPFLKLDGELNEEVLTPLKRKLFSLIVCSPGINEEKLREKVQVLNKCGLGILLSHLELDNFIFSRSVSYSPPSLFSTPNDTMVYPFVNLPSSTSTPQVIQKFWFPKNQFLYLY